MGGSGVSSKVVALAGGVMAIAAVPAAQEVWEPLLRSLLQVQDEQAETIAHIDANVQRLIEGPWYTARTYLEEAALPETTPDQREDKLRRASAALHEAIPLQPEATLQRAYACLNLALVQRLLGESGASMLQAHYALDAATACVMKELEDVKKKKTSRNRRVAMLGPTGLLVAPRLSSAGAELRSVWSERDQIRAAVVLLCGEEDIRKYSQQLDVKIAELKLAKTVKKLTAVKDKD
jgi:hypothetical protein